MSTVAVDVKRSFLQDMILLGWVIFKYLGY